MRLTHRGVGTAVVAALVIAIIIFAGAAVYLYTTAPSGRVSTVTVTASTAVTTSTSTSSTSVSSTSGMYLNPSNLVQLAQQEGGSLNIYSIVDPTSFAVHYLPAFMQAYPWAKVNFVPLDPGSLVSRPIAEYQGNHVYADLVQFGPQTCAALNTVGALQQQNFTAVEKADGLPTAYQSLDWAPFGPVLNVVFYNTNLVNSSNPNDLPVPTTWQNLTNPIYKGKLALSDPTTNDSPGTTYAGLYYQLFNQNNATWTAWQKGLFANTVLQPFAGAAYTAVSQGEYAIGIDTLNDLFNGQEAGLPVAIDWQLQPTYPDNVVSCFTKDAPHPYMAMLFDEWMMSSQGQLANINSGYSSAIPAMNSLDTFIPSNATISTVGYSYYANYTNIWSPAFAKIWEAAAPT